MTFRIQFKHAEAKRWNTWRVNGIIVSYDTLKEAQRLVESLQREESGFVLYRVVEK